jgi:hypothetical protein
MFLLSLFSGSMFVLPIALTGGLYVGLRHQQVIDTVQGKPPPNINPDGTPRLIETTQYCQKAYGVDPYPYRYTCTYLPNSKESSRVIPTAPSFTRDTQTHLFLWNRGNFRQALALHAYQWLGWHRPHGTQITVKALMRHP